MLKKLFYSATALALVCASPLSLLAQTEDPVTSITPELPAGFDLDLSALFEGLMAVMMPAIGVVIGFFAAIWGARILWTKIRGFGR